MFNKNFLTLGCLPLPSFSESLSTKESDTTSLWDLPDIEYLESFQSSFHANKKAYVVKEEVFSPPIAKKSRREEPRHSEAESSQKISMFDDASPASDHAPETEKDYSTIAPVSHIESTKRTDVLESDKTSNEKSDNCSDQLQTSLEKIRRLDDLNKSLKDLLGESLGRLRDAEEINTRLEGQLRTSRQEAEAQKGVLACLTVENEAYKQRFGQVEQANRALLAELEVKAAAIETNVEQIKLLEESVRHASWSDGKDREIGHLRSLLEDLQSRLVSSEAMIKKLGLVNEDLNRQVQTYRNTISLEESLKDQLEESRDKLRQQEKRIEELKSYISHNDDDSDSQIQSLNVMVELRDEMMKEGEIRVNDFTSKLQVIFLNSKF